MTAADRVVILAAAVLLGVLFAAFWRAPAAASWAEVRIAGDPVGRYPLDHDRVLEIRGPLGVSRLEIRNGRVRFLESPCRNKVCVHSGWLSHAGEVAACLPNRVSVSLGGSAPAYDAVSF